MTPPRPTPAKLRALDRKLTRLIDEIGNMTFGDVHSSDSIKLEKLRSCRRDLIICKQRVEDMLPRA